MSRLLPLLLALALGGCASGPAKPKLPYDAWFVGLLAPNYMEVWVESVDVIDRRGLLYRRVAGGTAAIQPPPKTTKAIPGAGQAAREVARTNISPASTCRKRSSCAGNRWRGI